MIRFGVVDFASKAVGKVGRFMVQHDRTLLAGAAVAGVIVTVGTTARAAIKARDILDQLPEETEKLEVAKKVAPVVLPAMTAAAATIVAIIFAHRRSTQKIAALASAYTLSREALKEFQARTKEYVGEEGYKEIESGTLKKKIKEKLGLEEAGDKGPATGVKPADDSYVDIVDTGSGNDYFYDELTEQRFKASRQYVENAANHLQHRINSGYYGYDSIPYTEFLSQLGVRRPKLAYLVGWTPHALIDLRLNDSIVLGDHPHFIIRFGCPPDVILDSLK